MSRPRESLLGRDDELRAIADLIRRATEGESGTLALIGPAGNGKTALLEETARRVEVGSPRLRVLRSRGVESEAEVAFAGLLELVRPLVGLIAALPEPQARALEGAFALTPAEETDRFTVSAATLGVFSLAASEQPLLVLVDDLHWLDPPSAQAIVFAARRLWHEGVAILLSSRPERHVTTLLDGISALEVGALGPAEAGTLARASAADELTAEQVEAVVRGTGGNPLAIIEATRNVASAREALDRVVLPLPVAERIRVGVERRLEKLDPRQRRAVSIVAAAGTRSPSALIESALAIEDLPMDALNAAEGDGILRISGEAIEFEHPLTRSAVYSAAGGGEQRTAHAALARASEQDSAERAWHLAAAAVGPDEVAASALEAAGKDALNRGAPSTAIRAFDRASALSRDTETGARRLLLAGGAARMAGDLERARDAISLALERSHDPLTRADALGQLFQMDSWRAPVATAQSIAIEAERLAELDTMRSAQMLAEASAALARSGSIPQGVEFAERAFAQVATLGKSDDAIELCLLFARVMDARAPEVIEPLLALGERLHSLPPSPQTLAHLQQVAWMEIWVEEYGAAETLLDHAMAVGRRHAPGTLPMTLAMRGELAFRRGKWQVALADTAEAATLAADFGQTHPRGLALTCQARVEACLGRERQCRATAETAAAIGRELGGEGSPVSAYGAPALGLLELGLGRPRSAIPHLERLVRTFRVGGIKEPGVILATGDLVEAYARAGRADDAQDLLDEFAEVAATTRRIGAQAIAERCRGLLADQAAMEGHFRKALELHSGVETPFERGRTHLVFGERLVATGQLQDAQAQLSDALAIFQRIGAPDWEKQASRELTDAGGVAESRAAVPPDALTPQELQVARLAASGASISEAGAQLFLSAKTVEALLRQIYEKLGVRSESELAALIAAATDRGLAIRSFGEFQVLEGGRAVEAGELGGREGQEVLAALLAGRGPASRRALAKWVWPEMPEDEGESAVQRIAQALRESLGSRIRVDEATVELVLGDEDKWDVLRLLESERDPEGQANSIDAAERALAEFSAPLFPEWSDREWLARLEADCAEALTRLRARLAEEFLRQGRPGDALPHFTLLSQADPTEAAWHRGLLQCHAAAGSFRDGTITIVFTDIEDSTRLADRLGDREWAKVVRSHDRIAQRETAARGGRLIKSQGDGVMLAFSSALAAVEFAIAFQRRLDEELTPVGSEALRVRIGLHSGEAIAEGEDYLGRAVIVAARIADSCSGGEIAASSVARELVAGSEVEDCFDQGRDVELKGLTRTQRVHKVEWRGAPLVET